MSSIPSLLSLLRHRCGNARQFVRDHVCGVTRAILFETACDEDPVSTATGVVRFQLGSSSDLSELSENPYEYGAAEKQFCFERLRRGDSLVLGKSGGEIVFYAWLMYRQMDVDVGVLVPLARDVAYSYKVFTVAHARGNRICSTYYSHIKRVLRAQGYARLICRITTGNTPSIHAHMRAGFQPTGQLRKLVLGGWPLYQADVAMRTWLPSVCPSGYFSSRGFLQRHEE